MRLPTFPAAMFLFAFAIAPRVGRASPALEAASAQAPASPRGVRHHIALEAGGPAVLGSLVYELQPRESLGLRAGLAVVPLCFNRCAIVPITTGGGSYWTPGERHHLEVGMTFTYAWMDDDDARFVVPTVGYRYQPRDGHLVARVEATPLLRLNDLGDVVPWGGASVGWRF